MEELLRKGFQQLSIPITDEKMGLLKDFFDIYSKRSREINLSTLQSEEDFAIKHVLDSAAALPYFKDSAIIGDLGSGGGFPGIILAILNPSLQISLIDVVEKKVTYLKEVIEILNLKNCQAFNTSKEKIPFKFDVITSRALGNLKKLLFIAGPLLKPNGSLIVYKARAESVQKELKDIKKIPYSLISLNIPFLDAERNLVVINK